MSQSENERNRRREESRRRARRNDYIAVGAIVLAVAIVAIAVSCAFGGNDGNGESTTTAGDSTASVSTSATSATKTDGSVSETHSTAATTTVATTTAAPTTTTTVKRPNVTIDTTGRYLQPAGAKWNLLLVNDWNPMPANWEANMTKTVINASVQNGSVDSRIAEPLNAMVAACRAAGGTIWAQSMHRPYDIQEALFERAVNRYLAQGYSRERAEAIANTEVKRPGYSEHNTGLAVDFNSCSHDFTGTVAHQWLVKHCAEYGFILRFPEGKEEVTGVMYESWHYRYVGKEAAKEIMSEGITLEEYCERYGL